ncbi:MAG TPA: hypothetical protein VK178_04630 [Opitutaceae bacterium]|nr:hypothetical protein [Opitutaceae bacterium]
MSPALSRIPAAFTAALFLVSGYSALADEPVAAPVAEAPAQTAKPAGAKKLYEGMPSAELRALIGEPKRIVPAKLPNNKTGEWWVYERLKGTTTESVAIGTEPITSRGQTRTAEGTVDVDNVVGFDVVKENRTVEIYEVASFLIYDGVYVTNKKTEEKRPVFQ